MCSVFEIQCGRTYRRGAAAAALLPLEVEAPALDDGGRAGVLELVLCSGFRLCVRVYICVYKYDCGGLDFACIYIRMMVAVVVGASRVDEGWVCEARHTARTQRLPVGCGQLEAVEGEVPALDGWTDDRIGRGVCGKSRADASSNNTYMYIHAWRTGGQGGARRGGS